MKTILRAIICVTISCSSFYEAQTLISLYGTGSIPSNNSVISTKRAEKLTYDEIEGNAYYNNKFLSANVSKQYEDVLVRYNSYTDQMEFKIDDKVMILPRNAEFSKIIFNDKSTFELLTINNQPERYYLQLVDGENTLYKKIETKFIDFIPAPTPYHTDQPAKFRQLEPTYYLKTSNNTFCSLKTTDELFSALIEKKKEIKTFLNSNKIKLNKEADLIKLVLYLNSN